MLKINDHGLLEYEQTCKQCENTRLPAMEERCPFCGRTGAEIQIMYDQVKKFNQAYQQVCSNKRDTLGYSKEGKDITETVLIGEDVQSVVPVSEYDRTFQPKELQRQVLQLEKRVNQMEQWLANIENKQKTNSSTSEPIVVTSEREAVKLLEKDLK